MSGSGSSDFTIVRLNKVQDSTTRKVGHHHQGLSVDISTSQDTSSRLYFQPRPHIDFLSQYADAGDTQPLITFEQEEYYKLLQPRAHGYWSTEFFVSYDFDQFSNFHSYDRIQVEDRAEQHFNLQFPDDFEGTTSSSSSPTIKEDSRAFKAKHLPSRK